MTGTAVLFMIIGFGLSFGGLCVNLYIDSKNNPKK